MAMIGGRDLSHRLLGGGRRRKVRLLLHHALDVLDNDDRVVDHDADGEHQRQQRDGVGRIAERDQHHKSPDKAHRNRNHRDDCGTQVSEEQKHHDRDKDEGLEQRFEDLANGIVNEDRAVVDDLRLQSVGKASTHLVKRCLHCGSGSDGICTGREKDSNRHGGPAIEAAVGVIILGAQLHARHVLQPQPGPIRVLRAARWRRTAQD
jgi:hypothetical protein